MSEYSTVDFSVLLLMGTYVLSEVLLRQRGKKRSVKVHLGACAQYVSLLGTDSHPGRHLHQVTVPAAGCSDTWCTLPAWHYCQSWDCSFSPTWCVSHGIFLWVFCLSSLWRSRGISGKDTRAGGWEKLWGPAWGWNFHGRSPLPVNSYRGVPEFLCINQDPYLGHSCSRGDSVSSGLPDSLQPTREFKKILLLG